MMAIQRHPMESALSLALDPPARQWRLSRRGALAVSVVILLHAGLGAYLYSMKMNPPHEVNNGPPPMVVTTWTPPKPTPPPPRQPSKPHEDVAAPIHHATMVEPSTVVKPLPILPDPTKVVDTRAELKPTIKSDPGPALIQNPDWVSRPTPEQMTRYYPELAMEDGLSGKVVLNCGVTASGGVANCQVLSETPAGHGFGAAALKLAGFFKLSPRTENGKTIDGALVRIPLVFNAGE